MVEEELQRLMVRRDELLKRIEAIENDYRQGLDANSEEQAMQLENAEVQAGIGKAAVE
ncbi:MAG: hypothetical protein HKM22_06385, partial [Gammaproteobacteria bacterium]|nr:hypothetical protein [Gammaproteobacteria bacterium]